MRFVYTLDPLANEFDENVSLTGQDTIFSATLSRNDFLGFIDQVKNLNQDRHFNIYVYGDYLEFLKRGLPYTYIQFIITSEHVMDLSNMYLFMVQFHELCKAYSIGYDLIYGTNLSESDINHNPRSPLTFNIETIQSLRLYKGLTADGVSLIGSKNLQTVGQLTLYSTVISLKSENIKLINQIRTKKRFLTPIKIT